MRASVSDVRKRIEALLVEKGLNADEACAVAEDLLQGELTGRRHHGLALLPGYIEQIASRRHSPRITEDQGGFFLVDGGDNLGPIAAGYAVDQLLTRVPKYGVAAVGVRNKHPFAMAGTYALRIASEGFVAVCMCNSRARVAPYGGSEPVLGPNPIAFAFPTPADPIVIDFATSSITMGDVRAAAANGGLLPPDTAYDADGNPTRSPQEALEGCITVFGGHKGYCLALAVELLAGPVIGAKAGNCVPGTRGFLFMGIDTHTMVDHLAFAQQVQALAREIRQSRSLDPTKSVRLPGDESSRLRADALTNGIELPEELSRLLGLQ